MVIFAILGITFAVLAGKTKKAEKTKRNTYIGIAAGSFAVTLGIIGFFIFMIYAVIAGGGR